MLSVAVALSLLSMAPAISASPVQRCTGTISSLDDVADAVKCTTINIESFTVPAGQTFSISAPDGATINVKGEVTFGVKEWSGPLFELSGNSITFNGNGYTFNGQGQEYWDGLGSSGSTKPHPMMKIKSSGTFTNLVVKNSPQQCFSIGNDATLTISKVTVDNSDGNSSNSKSSGKPAGHNTDGFDVSASDVTIEDSTVSNQDDCIAINKGYNIIFKGNSCTGGHGISIGSISSGVTVSGVQILNNVVKNNQNGLRIKTDASATGSTVSGITYSGNTVTGATKYGVIIDQSYPSTLGTPGKNVKISGVTFSGTNTISVASGAKEVEVNCGDCSGTWNWSGLKVSGGSAGSILQESTSVATLEGKTVDNALNLCRLDFEVLIERGTESAGKI
ncbi:Glycosyl hydrolases family 28, partial [Rhizoctonia solani]